MRTIQVNYDLRKPGRNYEPVYEYLRSYGTWAHPLESLWLIRTDKTAQQVWNEMWARVDANDNVFVFDVTGDSWWGNGNEEKLGWVEHLMDASRPVPA